MQKLRLNSRVLIFAALLFESLTSQPAAAATVRAATRYIPGATSLGWIRVSPADPHTIYAGGRFVNGSGAAVWLLRSTDAGNTWIDMSDTAGFYNSYRCDGEGTCSSGFAYTPIVIGADGAHLYAEGGFSGPSPASASSMLYISSNLGGSWTATDANTQDDCDSGQYGGGPASIYASPVNSTRLYTLINCGGGDGTRVIKTSSDGGRHWKNPDSAPSSTDPLKSAGHIDNLLVDPTHADTVFANLTGLDGDFAARSDDAGVTWTTIVTPTATPAIDSYAIGINPRDPGRLEAHATNVNEGRLDQVFVSSDRGRTWNAAYCPGDLNLACPTITAANVFGDGHNYAIFPDGIHAFDGPGPSGPRLALSDKLPLKPADIKDLESGSHAGDPIYVLGSGASSTVDGVLYRSSDGGATWQKLPIGIFPPAPSPNLLRGALLVPHAAHRVAAPFIAAYRKLGVGLIGLPITDPIIDGGTLEQYFEHMRLLLQGGKVTIGELGSLVYGIDGGFDDSNLCLNCVGAVLNSLRAHIFKVSAIGKFDYALSGDFLRFWKAHGGQAVFGAPIADPFKAKNGDGSKRTYLMQYFENVRLELHPENRNPAYRVELGLIGDQYLADIGWLRAE